MGCRRPILFVVHGTGANPQRRRGYFGRLHHDIEPSVRLTGAVAHVKSDYLGHEKRKVKMVTRERQKERMRKDKREVIWRKWRPREILCRLPSQQRKAP
jgi:hypothetical protein